MRDFWSSPKPDSGVAELEDLESWRRRSPKHGAVAAEVEQLWSDIGRTRDLPWPSEAEIAGDRENDHESGRRSRFAWLARPRVAGGAIAWREGRFVFSGESPASVVAELNRYSVSQIEIADEELAELMISGTVLRNQIADWLEGLERAFPVRIDRVDGTRVIIRTSDRPQDTAI